MSDGVIGPSLEAAALIGLFQQPGVRWRGLRIGHLPKAVMFVPLVAQWLWLGLRYRSLTLPSVLDPNIETGGIAGESKADCLAQIGPAQQGFVSRWALVRPGENPEAVRVAIGLDYPLIVKPDIGWCGFGVRRLAGAGALAAYASAFPKGAAFLLQRHEPGPGEAGLFYVREPGCLEGRVAGITLRSAPSVQANGVSTVAELLARTRPSGDADIGLSAAELARIPPAGEAVPLSTIVSIRVGGRYRDGSRLLTPALAARVDAIARSMPDFHLGRFDVRFAALHDLMEGRFSVIEVNGAGSEAIHLWDPAFPIATAYAGVFAKQAMMFRMAATMRASGHRPVGLLALARGWLRQRRLIARYPASN